MHLSHHTQFLAVSRLPSCALIRSLFTNAACYFGCLVIHAPWFGLKCFVEAAVTAKTAIAGSALLLVVGQSESLPGSVWQGLESP